MKSRKWSFSYKGYDNIPESFRARSPIKSTRRLSEFTQEQPKDNGRFRNVKKLCCENDLTVLKAYRRGIEFIDSVRTSASQKKFCI